MEPYFWGEIMNGCLKRPARAGVLIALACLLLLAGCGRTVFVAGGGSRVQPGHAVSGRPLSEQADAAWQAGNYAEAERLYNVVARDAALPTAQRALAWERVARAAQSSGNVQGAQSALNFWKDLVPGAEATPAWREIQSKLGTPGTSPKAALSSGCVALALPLSGDYGPFGNKIAAGAAAAQGELSRSGISMDVRLVDTESSDWLDKLSQLPPQCVMVGGPLRTDRYTALRARNLQTSHAFFAFLSSLEGTDEGKSVWRFFSSPQDQIDAVLGFAGRLGISRYGVLAPSDTYGRRMSDMFLKSVRANGAAPKFMTYQSGDPSGWNDVAQEFVGGASASIQAAFIPDSWKNLELLAPFLFYQGEDRLVLMGTSLWEQGLSNRSSVNVANLELAFFPGAWNPTSSSPAAGALVRAMAEAGKGVPDFWEGIGYDFVRMASVMHLQSPWTPAQVNARLATAQDMEWSMAPIRWSDGKASQALFVFQPVQSGFELADPVAFKARYDEIVARHARRTGK